MSAFASSSVARVVRSWARRHAALSWSLTSLGVAVLTAACLSTAGGGGEDDCEEGSEGCACFGNETCLDDLSCRSNLCVDTSEAGDDDAGSKPSKPSASDDDETDDDESDDSETDEAPASDDATDEAATDDATDDPEADDEATDDAASDDAETDDAATDESATDDASTDDPSTDDPVTDDAITDETATDDAVTDETVTDEVSTDDVATDDTVTDEADPPECTEGSGTCAAGDGIDCVEGQYAERDCTACAVTSCGLACCGSVWPLVAETYPYLRRDDLLDTFEADTSEVYVRAAFTDLEEFAAVGFTFASPQAIGLTDLQFSAVVTGSVSIQVSLEQQDGETGCLYTSSGGELTSEIACWGDWELTGYGGSADSLLIRINSEVEQLASLSLTSITW